MFLFFSDDNRIRTQTAEEVLRLSKQFTCVTSCSYARHFIPERVARGLSASSKNNGVQKLSERYYITTSSFLEIIFDRNFVKKMRREQLQQKKIRSGLNNFRTVGNVDELWFKAFCKRLGSAFPSRTTCYNLGTSLSVLCVTPESLTAPLKAVQISEVRRVVDAAFFNSCSVRIMTDQVVIGNFKAWTREYAHTHTHPHTHSYGWTWSIKIELHSTYIITLEATSGWQESGQVGDFHINKCGMTKKNNIWKHQRAGLHLEMTPTHSWYQSNLQDFQFENSSNIWTEKFTEKQIWCRPNRTC